MTVEITLMIGGQSLVAELDDASLAQIAAALPRNESETSRWLTIPAAADYLGLTQQAVRKLIDRRRIEKHQPSGKRGRILIRRADLDRYLEADNGRSRP